MMLAEFSIGGDGLVNQLLTLLLFGICIAIVYAMGYWFFTRPKVPPLVMMIWNGLFILVGGIVIINFLMGLGGNQFIKW